MLCSSLEQMYGLLAMAAEDESHLFQKARKNIQARNFISSVFELVWQITKENKGVWGENAV